MGKAFYEAGRQAVKSKYILFTPCHPLASILLNTGQCLTDAKHRPQNALGGDAAGVGTASSSSPTDQLTRQHLMTLDEANLILNVKREDSLEKILKVLGNLIFNLISSLSLRCSRTTNIFSKRTLPFPHQKNPSEEKPHCLYNRTIYSPKYSARANE